MIKSEYLADQNGAGKYGNCASCGKFYNEDPKMIRLTFKRDDSTRGSEICMCDECRQAAIEAIRKAGITEYDEALAIEWVGKVPSVQPEIIRCKECVYSHMTYGGECKYCDKWGEIYESGESLYLEGDFFCGFGERKTDD